jgi:cytosine/adenosine deaminase-related metal-dependent hydrolase
MSLMARLGGILIAVTIITAPAAVRTDDKAFALLIPIQATNAIAITDVTVIDVESGARIDGANVVTVGDRIARVGRPAVIPPGATRVNGRGKFLVPGLWDMHSHDQAAGVESLELFLANGVVGTRDMGSDADFILPLRDRIARGEAAGPEIVAAGPILDDRPPDWPFRRRVRNAEEARAAVRDLKRRGVDFIKVHDSTPRDAFFAIADEAAKLGLPFAGHVPFDITVEEAADAGMRSIEHLANYRIYGECSGRGAYSAAGCEARFAKLTAKHVWQTPTVAFFRALPELFSGTPMAHGEYASESLLAMTRKNREVSKLSDAAVASLRAAAAESLPAVRDLAIGGPGVLAGCDGLVPGFCLHDELQALAEAGLSPLQSLQAATINAAKYFGRETVQGTIEADKRADLVLLDSDPLLDIRNTRRVAAVVVRGRLISRTEIDRILAAHRR